MFTVVESRNFSQIWPAYWTEDELGEFTEFIANNPDAGEVVPRSGGVRKIRWSAGRTGKRGGVRVIYCNRLPSGKIWLLTMYAKAKQANAPAHILKALKEAIDEK